MGMELSAGKVFETAKPNLYLGTIVDVVDMPNIPTQYGPKNKVRIVWLLNNLNGSPALDSKNERLNVVFIKNASLSEKSELFKMIRQILNAAPPLMNSTDQLAELLIGRSNRLFVTNTPDEKNPNKVYANVGGVSPLETGDVAPQTQGYVRDKDRVKTPQGQTMQRTPQAPQQTGQQTVQGQQSLQTGQPGALQAAPPVNNLSF